MKEIFKNIKIKMFLQTSILYLVDMILVSFGLFLAIMFRFDMVFPFSYYSIYFNTLPILLVTSTVVFVIAKLYKNIWLYASIETMFQISFACLISSLICYFICDKLNDFHEYVYLSSRGIFSILVILLIALIGGLRFSLKIFSFRKGNFSIHKSNKKRIMIIGAGWAGASIIRDLKAGRQGNAVPIVAIDDDIKRIGTRINGVPVRSGTDKIKKYAEIYKVDEIIIAIATPKGRIQDLIDECLSTGCHVRRVANLTDINNSSSSSVVRDIDLNDLLGRPEEKLDLEPVKKYCENKIILITGGGGSIGSELCRQMLTFNINKIILFDISENYIFDLKNEMQIQHGMDIANKIETCVGSVADLDRLNEVFAEFKPEIVIHAAAHKHVPLMESCPNQAVKNNVFGSYNVANTAIKHNVDDFVLISTDKAVNPTNVMGATKRLSELIMQGLNHTSNTNFMIVRFGNVLGSHGSVVPLFEQQIRAGGPVTLTDKNIIRYFMSVQEATRLVLQATTIAKGGELFVLDMGEPVKIYDLATRMVKLYSNPDNPPVEIKITGLRQGEKLYEELLMNDENIVRTELEKIFVTKSDIVSKDEIENIISKLENTIQNNLDVRQCLMELIPNYKDADDVNKSTNQEMLNKHRVYNSN